MLHNAHAALAASLQSLCAQFTELERYEHACSLRSADARTTFACLLSTASHVPVAYPSYPTVASSESPHFQHEQKDDTVSLPSLPLPHAAGAPPSGNSMLTGPGAHPVPSASSTSLLCSRTLPAPHASGASSALYSVPRHGREQGSGHLRRSSQQSPSFHMLPLPCRRQPRGS
ncbi:hypothetical protein DFH11DRAFT_1287692 [Phellopilus nigrolimitatus]|nr:hypothetical protein DFH11DRAFT_1287692 [Phellopilus nigrolimitatus]